jgi:hypothetical protein
MYRLKKFAKKICPCCPPEPVKNCAVCILSNTLLIGHFITPILGSCKHSKRRFSNTQSFSISKIGLICDCFLFVFFGAMTFSYSYDTLQECVNLKEKIACLQLWGDQIFAVSGMNCMLCFLAQIKTRLEELNCWARLMEKSGSFGFHQHSVRVLHSRAEDPKLALGCCYARNYRILRRYSYLRLDTNRVTFVHG